MAISNKVLSAAFIAAVIGLVVLAFLFGKPPRGVNCPPGDHIIYLDTIPVCAAKK